MDTIKLSEKCALVTGGALGLGLSCAQELLRDGVKKCAILDVNSVVGEESSNKLKNEFGKDRVLFVKCDVSNMASFEEAIKQVINIFGQLDIIINNAGICNEVQWEKTIQINLIGVINGTVLGFEYMGKNKGHLGGTVINMASILAFSTMSTIPVYTAVKHGVLGYTKSMADPYHYEKTGIRCMALCPGVTTSNLTVSESWSKNRDDYDEFMKWSDRVPKQPTEAVGKALVEILKKGKSGSIWVTEGNQPVYEIVTKVEKC